MSRYRPFLIPGTDITVQQPIPLTKEWVVEKLAFILMEHALNMCDPEVEWFNRYGTLLNLWGAQLGLPDPKAFFFFLGLI